MLSSFLRLIFVLLLGLAVPAWANDGGGGDAGGMMSGGGSGGGLNSGTTKAVVKKLTRGASRCGTVKRVYRFDCYRQVYRLANQDMNGIPAYSDAQRALMLVEQALEQVMAQNADPATPPIRKGLQVLRPIKPEAVPRATQQVESAMQEAETILLRSSERGGVHYARIAEAVNSNKVLLRSLLEKLFGPLAPLLRIA